MEAQKRKPVLIVYQSGGDHSFLGRLDDPNSDPVDEKAIIEDFDRVVSEKDFVTIYDSFPIGNRTIAGPGGLPMRAPSLGTMNWCVLEPICKHRVRIDWYYIPSEQGEYSRTEFDSAYQQFVEELEVAKTQHAMGAAHLQAATPEDIQRMEQVAKNMGLGTGSDLLQALKDGGKILR